MQHVSNAVKMIRPHYEKHFIDDAPFYLAMMHRFHSQRALYYCEEVQSLFDSWRGKVEEAENYELGNSLVKFLKR